jgi:hypothetical protein
MDAHAENLARDLREKTGCHAWVVGPDAVAYSFPDILVDRGKSLDYPAQLERTRSLRAVLFLRRTENCDATTLELPDKKYWPIMLISPGESEARHCCRIKNRLHQWEPFAFKARACGELTSATRKRLRAFLEDWTAQRGSEPVNGETLNLGKINIEEYRQSGTRTTYPQDGFTITCSSYVPTTWPWIELYLLMRKKWPREQRLSLEFFNPGMPDNFLEEQPPPTNIVPLKFT